MEQYNDIPKYKKKKEQSSDSKKRSNHKHEYERVISCIYSFTYVWSDRCKICGRFKSVPNYLSKEGLEQRVYDEKLKMYLTKTLSLSDIHQKFPETRVFERIKDENGKIIFEVDGYTEVEFKD